MSVLVEAESERGGDATSGRGWNWEWEGAVRTVVELPARGEVTINLQAIVRQPCTLNLNRFLISFPGVNTLSPLHLPSTRFQRLVVVE
jgi:hypothetical protein